MPFKKKAENGSAVKTATAKREKAVVKSKFNAKPMFVYLTVRTGEDGLLSNYCKLKLRCNTEKRQCMAILNSEANVFDSDKYSFCYANIKESEPAEAIATTLLQRFSMTTFSTNPARRLPKNTVFSMYLRVAVSRSDQVIRVGLRKLVMNGQEITRENNEYRMFRKAVKLLPIAFARVDFEKGNLVSTSSSDEDKPAVIHKKKAVKEAPVKKEATKKPVTAESAKKAVKKVVKKPVKKIAASDDFDL